MEIKIYKEPKFFNLSRTKAKIVLENSNYNIQADTLEEAIHILNTKYTSFNNGLHQVKYLTPAEFENTPTEVIYHDEILVAQNLEV